jgi:glyoxylase-like metal-dependent hydrolase (beta-lactamase superfamily II)
MTKISGLLLSAGPLHVMVGFCWLPVDTSRNMKAGVHTVGHTSGSICIYEVSRKVLFTGDTVFDRGTLSYIGESGSVGDYIHSIGRLGTMRISEIYPGHGAISKNPEDDMQQAILNAKALLGDEEGVDVVHLEEVSM